MSTDMSLGEKVAALKKMHKRWDPGAKAIMEGWEQDLERLELEAAWLKHPNTKQLRIVLEAQLENIDNELRNNEDLPELDRKQLFKTKNLVITLFAILSHDPVAEMQEIGRQLDAEL